MKILMVYPQYPVTFWSFKHILKFASKRSAFPPLGLLTVASMLPGGWEKKVVDMNCQRLLDADLRWADYVFISAMVVQKESVHEVVRRCREIGVKTVAGGPLFTMTPEDFPEINYLVLGEAEGILPEFLTDFSKGNLRRIYKAADFPDIAQTPPPDWSLIKMNQYSSMSLQYSRGCPFNCEFCDIVLLNGHKPRTKSIAQMKAELDALYKNGWHNSVFIVDDNFIGNKNKLKEEILPAIIDWKKGKRIAMPFNTEVSINLADDDELIALMTKAGFNAVFVGIETPNEDSLQECAKNQNRNRNLQDSVRKLHKAGLEVQGGFIVGFDSDPLSIFKTQVNFIQKTGIVTAMVGLLNAPNGTPLFQRLKKENRILGNFEGSNTELNFIPKMKTKTLIDGYKDVLRSLYSSKPYYARIQTFLKDFKPPKVKLNDIRIGYFKLIWTFFWVLGIRDKGKKHFWKLVFSTIFRRPRSFPIAMKLALYGYHFRKVAEKYVGQAFGVKQTGTLLG
jgi:radical SAM superfamily enzyme YgiQ (UPF0313 family)